MWSTAASACDGSTACPVKCWSLKLRMYCHYRAGSGNIAASPEPAWKQQAVDMQPSALVLALLLASASSVGLPAAPKRIVLPENVVPEHYDLSIVPNEPAMTFTGSVMIVIDVKAPTTQLVLNAIDLVFGRVRLSDVAAAPTVSFDPEEQTATLTFAAPVTAGQHTLAIEYVGKINQNAAGLFAVDYDTPSGKQRALFTQFENSDARRFVPCWDEPARKATFALTATVPANGMALSNTPIASTETLPDGLSRVHFVPSPRMSSYLLFFGFGDFERISRTVGGVDVGVVVKRGDIDKAHYALEAASKLLPYYEDYFAAKYALPKLDLIAGPGESQFFGAMENWGAIFYFERYLLIDPRISTQADERSVYLVIAHEMSHQWFGDLVTMEWWDDLWLNEGFASWMQFKATDYFHPEWKPWLAALDSKEGAMSVDARNGTHPIIQPIHDVLQANEAFDTITYSKGQAVIRMLEDYLGAEVFRAGVRAYMKANAYQNTATDDFWRELEAASRIPVTGVAHDFTLQAGIPLIRVAASGGRLRLTQERFAADESGKVPITWRVPVIEMHSGAAAPWHGLVSRDRAATVAMAAAAVPIVNSAQTGYFRTHYDSATMARIVTDFRTLSTADQLGLLNDSRALGLSGDEPLGDFLDLTSQASPDLDPLVLRTIATQLQGLNFLYEGLPGQASFKAYCRRVLNPVLATTGWTKRPGESQNVTLLRYEVLSALSTCDDAVVIGEAQSRFIAYLKEPASLWGDFRHNVLTIVAAHADAANWDQLRSLAIAAKSAMEQSQLYALLGAAHDSDLARRALELSLAVEVPLTTRPTIVSTVARNYAEMAVDFVATHSDAMDKLIEPASRPSFVPSLAGSSRDLATITKLRAYAARHIPENARGDAAKAEAAIAYNAKVRTERLPEVDRWLARQKAQ